MAQRQNFSVQNDNSVGDKNSKGKHIYFEK
jgi:hypothetical protein